MQFVISLYSLCRLNKQTKNNKTNKQWNKSKRKSKQTNKQETEQNNNNDNKKETVNEIYSQMSFEQWWLICSSTNSVTMIRIISQSGKRKYGVIMLIKSSYSLIFMNNHWNLFCPPPSKSDGLQLVYWWRYEILKPFQLRHNGRDGVSNHQPHDCLLNRLLRRRSKKISKLGVIRHNPNSRWIYDIYWKNKVILHTSIKVTKVYMLKKCYCFKLRGYEIISTEVKRWWRCTQKLS